MPIPVRSIRLQKRSSQSLDTLSGASGEIFFDADRGTLRLYTANQAENIILADREWVTNNTFSGNYNDLTNKPTVPTDINQLSDATNLLFSGNYLDLVGAPDLESLSVDISTIDSIGDVDTSTSPLVAGQLLEWDGTNWVNTTVAGFTDTNTTYTLGSSATAAGADINITDDDANIQAVELRQGTGILITQTDVGQVTIANNATYAINDLSNVSAGSPAEGNTLIYSSGSWISSAPSGGVGLDDFSVTQEPASGAGTLTYNSGTFTYTPPDLAALPTLTSFSVTTDVAQSGGVLSYDDTSGVFTFRPANLSGYAELTDFSIITDGTPSGGGSLSYNSSNGEFTFVPADSAVSGLAEVVDDTTPELGGDLSLNGSNIIGTGNVNITGDATFSGGTVSADTFTSSATGAPVLTSASTITLTAPDGLLLNSPLIEPVGSVTGSSGVIDLDVSQNNIFGTNSLSGAWTPNFTNVPFTTNRSQTYIVIEAGTGNSPSSIQIDGVAQTVRWENQSTPAGTSGVYNVWSFTIVSVSSSSPIVFGNLVQY